MPPRTDEEISEKYEEFNKKYGSIKKGEKWERDVSVPKRTEKRKYVSELFTADEKQTEYFSNQIDRWFDGTMKSDAQFELGDTPIVLRELGAKELPIFMSQEVIVKITGEKHNIPFDEIKRIPQQLADPIMILKSDTYSNAYVVLTELFDKRGHDVIVAIYLDKYANRIKINKVASVHSRTSDYGENKINDFIVKQIQKGNLRYYDKNKSQLWATSRGLQLPKLVQSIPDNNIILEKSDIVNNYSMNNTEKILQDDGKRKSKQTLPPRTDEEISEKYEELNKKYGSIKKGEKWERDVSVPISSAPDKMYPERPSFYCLTITR